MVAVFCCGVDPASSYQECILYSSTIDYGLEALIYLVNEGWGVAKIRYFDGDCSAWMDLPIDAFDGEPIWVPLEPCNRSGYRFLRPKIEPAFSCQTNNWTASFIDV